MAPPISSSLVAPSLADYFAESSRTLLSVSEQSQSLFSIIDALILVARNGGTIYTCGNGGSACEAMHLVEELLARYSRHRPGIRAQHFLDAGTLTCWANDYEFSTSFARCAETMLTDKDALVVLSTSGNSVNIIQALTAARKTSATIIALLGKDGGLAKPLAHHYLIVNSSVPSHIQEAHLAIIHFICQELENSLFPLP